MALLSTERYQSVPNTMRSAELAQVKRWLLLLQPGHFCPPLLAPDINSGKLDAEKGAESSDDGVCSQCRSHSSQPNTSDHQAAVSRVLQAVFEAFAALAVVHQARYLCQTPILYKKDMLSQLMPALQDTVSDSLIQTARLTKLIPPLVKFIRLLLLLVLQQRTGTADTRKQDQKQPPARQHSSKVIAATTSRKLQLAAKDAAHECLRSLQQLIQQRKHHTQDRPGHTVLVSRRAYHALLDKVI
jgi:hypothetical protein